MVAVAAETCCDIKVWIKYRVNIKHSSMYLEMLTNWMIPQLAAERQTWLPLSARWSPAALASRCPHDSQRALAKQMDWPRSTKWPGVLQVATEITGPDRSWLFFLWGYVKDRVYYPHYPQPWVGCRNASLQLSTPSRRIRCREYGPS
jgi:hypothetical protein